MALLAAALLGGCGASDAHPAHPIEQAGATPQAEPREKTGSKLERERTGQERPTIVVRNRFVTVQHVFVDWARIGEVRPGTSASFDVGVGTHTLTCAESRDPDDRPASVTETFEAGYRYRYEIAPE